MTLSLAKLEQGMDNLTHGAGDGAELTACRLVDRIPRNPSIQAALRNSIRDQFFNLVIEIRQKLKLEDILKLSPP